MTARVVPVPPDLRCAACNKSLTTAEIAETDYRCSGCGADLGHLDFTPSGMLRGVFGWLHSPGDVLAGRYRVRAFLGKGGFAATYLVDDQRLAGKRRALKEIPELFFDERETEILARIRHPAVPDIIDRFTCDGMVYLVLEFGGERTLDGVRDAEGGKIPFAHLWPWIDQLCDVLAYLHAQTPPIVHRDLKPANVLLDEADRVMLIDFGIAKNAAPDMRTGTVARSASHGFSPPEQVMGIGTDQRSDVYALGATLYALLTGHKPPAAHERVAGAELLPPRHFAPGIPAAVEDAILCALELSMARRYATISDFRRALLDAQDAQDARAPDLSVIAPRTVFLRDVLATGRIAAPLRAATGKGTAAPTRAVLFLAVALVLLLAGGAAWWLTQRGTVTTTDAPIATPSAPAAPASSKTEPVAPIVRDSPAAAPSEGPSALQELLKNRSVQTESTPEPEATEKSDASQAPKPQQPQPPHKRKTRAPADQWKVIR